MSIKNDLAIGGLALVALYLLYKRAQESIGAPVKNFVDWVVTAPQEDDPDTPRDESNSLLSMLGFKPFKDDPDTARDESHLGFWAYLAYWLERLFSMASIREGVEERESDNCDGDEC